MGRFKTFAQDLKYAFHVSTHPLDGFWDLKHEKRGRTYIAIFLLVMFVITSILDKQFNGYTFNVCNSGTGSTDMGDGELGTDDFV